MTTTATADLAAIKRGSAVWRGLADFYEKHYPDWWRKCNPRLYNTIGDYHSPKVPAIDACTALAKKSGLFQYPGIGPTYEFWCANQLARFQFPMYFIAPDMAMAIRQTKPPMALRWHEMELPMEAAVFMLPKGALVHPKYGECVYVSYARLKTGERYKSALIPDHEYCSLNGSFVLMTSCPFWPSDMMSFHYNFAADKSPVVELGDIEASMAGAGDDTVPSLAGGTGMDEDDNRLMAQVAHYVFGTLLLMLNRPELVERGQSTRKTTRSGIPVWTPNIIGPHYRIRREGTGAGEGTHASPRAHWRRGHWREHAYGPQYSLRKQLWIEPMFINPE